MLLSIIIPCYNAADKIGRCFKSLKEINFDTDNLEVLFIDDCSTDETKILLQDQCKKIENWHFLTLDQNSGSPSRPRNKGIEYASGKYVFFLDCDDEILPTALRELTDLAERTKACIVRSELFMEDGRSRVLMNEIISWTDNLSKKSRIEKIFKYQSTVPTTLIRTSLLKSNNILWREHLRLGEDTVFLAEVVYNATIIEYLPLPTFVYYKTPSLTPASTQRYGRRELANHLEVWQLTQKILLHLGLNYIDLRLEVGLRVAIESLIHKNRGDIDSETFSSFSHFIKARWASIQSFRYVRRIREILDALNQSDYDLFTSLIKPRLLIAGHDLKFIKSATSALGCYFNIKFDEWSGHELNDEVQSITCLNWAEYIWCEWFLGNAEWYAERKHPNQRLVIRSHRMELGREHGAKTNAQNVDAVIVVSTYFFEKLLERYPNISRSQARLIHNFIDTDMYDRAWHPDRLYTLAMIGILPSRKGYKRSLKLLHELKKHDKRYKLKVFSKRPEDLPWVFNDPIEMSYFLDCKNFAQEYLLDDSIEFLGHMDLTKAIALHRVGYILSLSDPDEGFPGPESFHLAIADGFAGGGVSIIRNWPGCEYIWQKEYIEDSEKNIIKKILLLSQDEHEFRKLSRRGLQHIRDNFSLTKFTDAVRDLFLELS